MRPSTGRISLWPAAVIGFVLVLAALSITPTLTLQAAPPADFVNLSASPAASRAATAKAYWELAVRVIQWKYSRGGALPEQVPEEFRMPSNPGKAVAVEEGAVRGAYWAKLREDWLKPENWHTTFNLDLSWPARNAEEWSRAILRFIQQS